MLKTEHGFTLPQGYIDQEGNLHRTGVMRLATAEDEILPLQDRRVRNNPGYLVIILLSRVVTRLGTIDQINPNVIGRLFAADLAYLQNLYNQINLVDQERTVAMTCPECGHKFEVEQPLAGES